MKKVSVKRDLLSALGLMMTLFCINTIGQDMQKLLFPSVGRWTPAAARDVRSNFDGLIEKAARNGTVMVIVGFEVDNYRPDGQLGATDQTRQRAAIKREQDDLLERLSAFEVKNTKKFEYMPFMAMELSADALAVLRDVPGVTSIQEDLQQSSAVLQSIPIIGAPTAYSGGFEGNGRTVAVLDTGVDKFHQFFNNRVVSEACYSTTSGNTTSYCPGGVPQSTASGSGVNCPATEEGCDHGTHVAGIAAGGHPQVNGNGVARRANIIAIQVFSRLNTCGSPGVDCTTSFTSDTLLGLERVYSLRFTYAIDAVNLSLGGGRYFSPCDTEQAAYKAVFDNLRAANIASVVATGNSSYTDSISSPSCVTSGFAVGSTNDGDVLPIDFVSDFSNSAFFMHLLAPGEVIISSVPGGFYDNKQGTSMAAPMVAGAWALMKQRHPTDTVTQTYTRLRYGGLPVLDSRNGLTKPRIRVDVAMNTSNVDPCGTANPINFGSPVNGSLSSADCLMTLNTRADIFSFNGTAGQGVAITYNSAGYDTYLYLVNSQGNIVQENNNGGGGTNSRIPPTSGFLTLPTSGTYYIYATSFNANTFGNYTLTLTSNAAPPPTRRPFDYDGDGRTDHSVFRPSQGAWYVQKSQQGFFGMLFGFASDKIAPADFDGDGKTDIAVFRPADSTWYVANSSNGTYTAYRFGLATDLPTPADYDGDGRADFSVFRPSNGTWYRQNSSNGSFYAQQFGANGDVPTVGDWDGDGKADLAIWRPSNGEWYQFKSQTNTVSGERFGFSTDKLAYADYDGDGRMDLAIFRPSDRIFYIKRSQTSTYTAFVFGLSTDIPTPGDYDGDGRADLSVFRPSDGNWYRQNSSNGSFNAFQFGLNGDKPTPTAYLN